jgi:hypothetical protein
MQSRAPVPSRRPLRTVGVAQRVAAVAVATLVAVIAQPVVCVSRAVGAAWGGPWPPGRSFQAAATAIWCLWSLSRLWVAVISRHSERAADLPRR